MQSSDLMGNLSSAKRGVRLRRHLWWLAVSLVVLTAWIPPVAGGQCTVTELTRIVPSDGAPEDYFGWSVAQSGDWLLVGACLDDDRAFGSGSAYLFHQVGSPGVGSAWSQAQKLTASDGGYFDWYGFSTAIEGEVAVIGAPQGDAPGVPLAGAAYVCRYDGSVWQEVQKLTASDAGPSDFLGSALAMADPVIAVGAPYDDDGGVNAGSAYLFLRDGSAWRQDQKLVASDVRAHDGFGCAVAVNSDIVLVGADQGGPTGQVSGAAYVFRFNGTLWVEEAKLTAGDADPMDQFGYSVATDIDLAIVGAPFDDEAGENVGAVYVFRCWGATWVEEQKLLPDTSRPDTRFGTAVAVRDGLLVMGAPGEGETIAGAGAAYLYAEQGGQWVRLRELAASDAASGDSLGGAVAIDGSFAAVGASRSDVAGEASGSVYLYSAIRELGLAGEPTVARSGDSLTFSTFYGDPGDPVALALIDVNGIPAFHFLLFGAFGPDHLWTISGGVGPGYSGIKATFASYGITPCGRGGASNAVTITFR
ncbi:MAG: FG-GAP repeat protein [Planctomycetota bacterium]